MKPLYVRSLIVFIFVFLIHATSFSQGGLDFQSQSQFNRTTATHGMAVGAAHVDASGVMYWGGSSSANAFTLRGVTLSNGGNTFGYVAKVASADASVYWRIQINGNSTTAVINIKAIATDASGNVYVTGNTNSGTFDFDPGAGTSNLTGCGFLAKYSSTGALTWVKNIGTSLISVNDIAISPTSGYIWIAGNAKTSVDIDPGASVVYSSVTSFTSNYVTHSYLAAYTTSGAYVSNSLLTVFGQTTANTDIALNGISFDTSGKIFAAGDCATTLFGFRNQSQNLLTNGFNNPAATGHRRIFIVSVNVSTLPATVQTSALNDGASADRTSADIVIDNTGNVYITGTGNSHPLTIKYSSALVKQWEKEETTITGGSNAIALLANQNVMITGNKGTGLLAAQYTASTGGNGFGNYAIIPQTGGAGLSGTKILVNGNAVWIGGSIQGTSKNVGFNLESFTLSSASTSYADAAWIEYAIDQTAPTCVITTTEPSSTSNGVIPVTYTFNEPVYNFDQGGTCVNCETSAPEKVSETVYTGYILPTEFGAFSLQVDGGGNDCTDAQKNSLSLSNKLQMTYVNSNPTILFNSSVSSPSLTSVTTVTVNFSEGVTGFTQSDLVVTNGVVSAFTAVSAVKYTFTLTASAEGLVKVEIPANAALDNTSLGNIAATFNFMWDKTGPVASITTTSSNPTSNNVIPLTIIFNEPVTGFAKADIVMTGGSGTFPGTLNMISSTEFRISFLASSYGTFSFSIATGSVTDGLNNTSPASGTLLNITYALTRPTVVITSPSLINGGATGNASFDFTITFDQNPNGTPEFTVTDLVLTNGTVSNFLDLGTTCTGKFTFISPGAGTIAIPENVAYNSGGLGNTAAVPFTITYDNVEPVVVSYSPLNNATGVSVSSNIAFTFNKNMKKSTGLINIVRKSDDAILQSFDVTTTNVTVSNNVVTINPPADLPANTELYVAIAPYALDDANGSHSLYQGAGVTFTTSASALSNQTITFNALPAKTFGDATFALTATASSGLAVTYASSDPTVATVSGSTVTIVGAGSTTIMASQAGNGSFNTATPVPQTLTVNKANQTITFNTLAAKTFGDATFVLGATTTSALPITYVSSNTAVATVSGSTVTILSAGSTTITASQAGNTNYNAAASVPQTLTINKAAQTIIFNPLPAKVMGDAAFALTATSSAGLSISYSSSNTAVATVSGNMVTIVGVGSASITAIQTGNANYNAATPVSQTLTVSAAPLQNQTITFGALAAKTFGDTPFALTGTASSGLPVSYTSSNTAVATVSGNTMTIVGAGSTTITASQAGNGSFNAAASVPQTLTVNKANQTITFNALAAKTFGDAAFTLTGTAGSGLSVTYVSSNTSVATVSGTTVTIVGAGSTTITASQTGNGNYNAAPSVPQMLTINKANQTITFNALAAKTVGDPAFTLTSTATSGLAVSFVSSNTSVATVSGTTVTIVGAGSTTITASQAGNANYNAAPSVGQILNVTSAALQNQTITFGALAAKTFGDPSFSLSATASSGLTVSFSSSNTTVATVSGTTVTIVGAGSTTITASQAGNATFNPAASVDRTLIVNKAGQTVTFNTLPTKTFGDGDFTLSATSTSGLPVSYTSSNTSVATISGNTVTIVGAGSSTITSLQPGNANYNAAVSINQTLTVNKASQTITFDALSAVALNDGSFSLTGFSNSGLTISYSSSNTSVATVSGNTVTIVGEGSTTITASQSGNTNYTAAVSVNRSLTVNGLQSQTISFSSIPDKVINEGSFTLNASASSGLTVSYSSSSSNISLSGSQVSLLHEGRATIRASQSGNAFFNAAPMVERSFCVNPVKPVVTLSDNNTEFPTLTSSAAMGNQWFLNGTEISGETNTSFTVTGPGIYTVRVTIETCASEFSDAVPLVITGLTGELQASLRLYPNPVSHELHVAWPKAKGTTVVTIYQVDGKPVLNTKTELSALDVDVASYPLGVYVVVIQSGSVNHRLRFLKN